MSENQSGKPEETVALDGESRKHVCVIFVTNILQNKMIGVDTM